MINDNLYIYCHYVNDNVCQFHERESRLFGSGGAINPGGDLARPGENVTGLSDFSSDLVTKRLELLKSMDPSISHVAVLLNPANATNPLEFKRMQAVAPKLGVTLVAFEIRSAEEIDRAFEAIRKQRRGAVILAGDALWNVHRERILALAAKHRLPALYPSRVHVDNGGLMTYGIANFDALFHRAASYVDKILKGAKPGDLPIEQPTRYALVINQKTASALGLKIPPVLRLQADQVIE